MDAGFFRGTSADQDSRFSDKEKKLMKHMKFESVLHKKVDMEKVNLDTIRPWITKRITELLGMEDEIVNGLIFELLNSEKHPDPKNIQITLTGFLQGKNARVFMGELWELLVSAQENIGGIPTAFLEKKKEEIRLRKIEQDRINAHIRRSAGELVAEADSTIPGPEVDSILTPAEVAAVKAQALKLAKDSSHSREGDRRSHDYDQNPITVLGAGMVTPQRTIKKDLSGYTSSPASTPVGRNTKPGWYAEHDKFVHIAQTGGAGILLIGDSLINGLSRYSNVWSTFFGPLRALNFGIGGDRTQHVLWRVENGEIPMNLHICVIHCGTNNIDRDTPSDITDGITSIVSVFQTAKPNAKIIITGLLPRDLEPGYRRQSIRSVNKKLKRWCQSPSQRNVYFLKPENDWVMPDGMLRTELYYTDYLHLGEKGNEKFAKSIYDMIMKLMQGVKIDYILSSDEDIENEDTNAQLPAVNDLRDKLNNLKAEKGKPRGRTKDSQSRSPSQSKSRSRSRSRSRRRSRSRSRSRSHSRSPDRSPRRRSRSHSRRRRYRSRSYSPSRRSRSPPRYRSPRRRRYSPAPRRHSRSPSRSPRRGRDVRRVVKKRSPSSASSRSPTPEKKKASASPPPTHRKPVKVEKEASAKRNDRSSSEESIKDRSKSPVNPISKDQLESPKYHKAEKAQGRTYRTKRSVSSSASPEKDNEKEVDNSGGKFRDRRHQRGDRKSKSESPRRRRSPPRGSRNRSPFYGSSQRRRSPQKSPPRRYRKDSPHRQRRFRSPSESPPRRVVRRRSPSPRRRSPSPRRRSPSPRRRSPSPRRRSPSPVRRQSPVRRRRDFSPSPRRRPKRSSPPKRGRLQSEDWSPSPSPSPPPPARQEKGRRGRVSEQSESSSESEMEAKRRHQKKEKKKMEESLKERKKEKGRKRKRSPSSSESESEGGVKDEEKQPKRVVTVRKRTPVSSESEEESGSEDEQKKRSKKKRKEKKDETSGDESASESDGKHRKKQRANRKDKKKEEPKKVEKKTKSKERSASPSPERKDLARKRRKKEPSESEKADKKRRDIPAQAKDKRGRPVTRPESPGKLRRDHKTKEGEFPLRDSEDSESEDDRKQTATSPEKRRGRKPEKETPSAAKEKKRGKRKEESESEESESEEKSESEGDRKKQKPRKKAPEKPQRKGERHGEDDDEDEEEDQMEVDGSSEDSNIETKEKKKKRHRKHKKGHSHGSSKHKKRKHKKRKDKKKELQDESEASDSDDDVELEKKLREKALQSMQRRQKESSVSSSD